MVPRRGFISLHHSGSISETLAGREEKRFAGLDTQRSCRATSWAWWCFVPHHQPLHLFFPKPLLPAARAQSRRAFPQLSTLTFGISPQDGYSRGSSRTSFSQAVSPCVLPPGADHPSSSAPVPWPEGSLLPWGRDTEGRGGLCAGTPPPALQGTHAFQRASQELLPFT